MSTRRFTLMMSQPDHLPTTAVRNAIVATLEEGGFTGFDLSSSDEEALEIVPAYRPEAMR